MAVFEVGDKVEGIDENIKGVVKSVHGTHIIIESNEGFLLDFNSAELIKTSQNEVIRVTNHEAALAKLEEESTKGRKHMAVKPKERNAPKMEVDLHINQLVRSSKGLSNHEMLNLQLETAKRQLEFAMRKRIQKIVFIHGVGEGVLKEELNYLFGKYDNLKFYDADYQNYGLGATEVYIYQNS